MEVFYLKLNQDRSFAYDYLRMWIEQIALSLYKKDVAMAAALVQQCENVLAGREISHFENTGPVQVLGGRV